MLKHIFVEATLMPYDIFCFFETKRRLLITFWIEFDVNYVFFES